MIPIACGTVLTLCTGYVFSDPTLNSWNFNICMIGASTTIRLIELATFNEPPTYDGQPACSRSSVLCSTCASNTFSYLFDVRCRHWNVRGSLYAPPDTRRDGSHAEFYADTFLLLLKRGLYLDAILTFTDNVYTLAPQNGTIFRDTFAITSNYNIHLPHPIIGALPLTIAIVLLVKNGLEFQYYATTLLAAPLTILPPSISPHSRPASALKREWPPLYDNPFSSTSINDFWTKRWQTTPRRCLLFAGANPGKVLGRYLGRVLGRLVGTFSSGDTNAQKREIKMQVLGSGIGFVMGAFLVSGVIHDLAVWGMGQGTDFRRVTGYFLIQGVGVVVERALGLEQLNGPVNDKRGGTGVGSSMANGNGNGHSNDHRAMPSKVSSALYRWGMKCDSQATLISQDEPPPPIESFSARNSTIADSVHSNLQETHGTHPVATTALIEHEVNPDTQTKSEVDSYVTLRPSQSISQVYNPHPFGSQGSSPPPVDEEELTLWHDGQVGLGSISQDHAEDFFPMYSGESGSNGGV
ncbi:membrane bound O-acyl transferase family protein [Ceratobasidium sp. AG-Ba]|nr:membrane bound O-acyl transferase family protein [Ceratobasidium sp. AG-Ba]